MSLRSSQRDNGLLGHSLILPSSGSNNSSLDSGGLDRKKWREIILQKASALCKSNESAPDLDGASILPVGRNLNDSLSPNSLSGIEASLVINHSDSYVVSSPLPKPPSFV